MQPMGAAAAPAGRQVAVNSAAILGAMMEGVVGAVMMAAARYLHTSGLPCHACV